MSGIQLSGTRTKYEEHERQIEELQVQMSGTQLSGTRARYEEHERQVEEIQAQIAKYNKPRPVIDFRVCHLQYGILPFILHHIVDLHTHKPLGIPMYCRSYWVPLPSPGQSPRSISSTLSTTAVLAVTSQTSMSTLASMACQILSHSNPWTVWKDAVAVQISTRFPGYTYEIYAADQQPLKRVSFMYRDRITFELEPILRD